MNQHLRLPAPLGPAALFVLLLLFAAQACEFTTAHIERAVMARAVTEESEPIEETDSFHGSESVMHCSVLMANTPEGTPVKAVWYSPGEGKKVVLDSTEITMEKDGWIDFSLTLSQNNLPYGAYAVDLYVGNTFAQTVPFTIEPMYPDSHIQEAVIARAVSETYFPTDKTLVFDEGSTVVYAPVYVAGQPAGTVFAAQWYVHDEAGDRMLIDTAEVPFDEEGWIRFLLSFPNGLSAGKYSVDLLVDNTVEHTLEFRAE